MYCGATTKVQSLLKYLCRFWFFINNSRSESIGREDVFHISLTGRDT